MVSASAGTVRPFRAMSNKSRRRRRIGVPEIVMDGLEVPLVRAGLDVDRDHRVAEQVGALAVAAVGAGDRRGQRQVEQSALFVEREVERPGVGAKTALPAVAFPGVVADLARLRHRAELPELGAGARIERPGVADTARRSRRRVRADDDDVPVDERHRVVRHDHVHFACLAEAGVDRAGRGVERDQPAAGGEDDARRLPPSPGQ